MSPIRTVNERCTGADLLKSCHDTNRGISAGGPRISGSPAFGGARAALVNLLAVAGLVAACAGPSGNGGGQASQASADSAQAIAAPAESEVTATSALGGYLAARHARLKNDPESAARFYIRSLEDDPANPDLLRRGLLALLAARRVEAAGDLARRLIEIESDAPVALLALGAASVGRGDYLAAERWLETGPKVGFSRYLSPLLLSWTRLGRGDGAHALEVMEPLAKVSAFAALHAYHAGLIADLLGKPTLAETNYVSAVGAVRGGLLRVVQATGVFYERAGRGDEARALYDAYLDQNPDTTFLDLALQRVTVGATPERTVSDAREGFAEALYGVAIALFQERANEPALIYVQLALHLRPDLDMAQLLLGDLYEAARRYKEAAAAYRMVPRDSPLSWAVRLRRANVLDRIGETDKAAGELRDMALDRPERSDALIALAEIYRSKERYTEAAAAYDQAVGRIPNLEQRHWSLLYARGMSLERSDQWDRAEADFLHALELEPDQPLVLNYLGYSWVEKGHNLDKAREMIESAVAQRPNDGYIVDSLGWVLYRLGEYKTALRHLERAVELRPGDSVIIDHFGDALWRVERYEEAQFQWLRALSFGSDDDLAATIREKLNGRVPGEISADNEL